MTIRTRLMGGFAGVALLVGFVGALSVRLPMNQAENASARQAEYLAEAIATHLIEEMEEDRQSGASGTAAELHRYVETLHKFQKQRIVLVNTDALILEDVIAQNEGTRFRGDTEGEVRSTIQDGVPRTFHQHSAGSPDGLWQVVVPVIGREGRMTGALIMEYTALHGELVHAAEQIERTIMLVTFAGMLLAILLGYAVSRSITGPIQHLTGAARAFATGRLDTRVTVPRGGELNELAVSFNEMADDLMKSHGVLQDVNAALELRVKERTAEMDKAITQLLEEALKRRAAEQAKDEYRRQYDLILTSAGEGIFGLDTNMKVVFVNPAAARILGYRVDDLVGLDGHDVWHHSRRDGTPFPRDECQICATTRDGAVHHVADDLFWRLDGSPLPVEYTSTPIRDAGRITGVVVTFNDITVRRRMEEELRALTLVDELTGLYNRRGFMTLGEQLIRLSARTGTRLLLVFADLDGLKKINDRDGHHAGDRAIRESAQAIRGIFRESDVVARLGGDEFAILAMENTGCSATTVESRIKEVLDERNARGDLGFALSVSLGIACCEPASPCDITDLLTKADERMYRMKRPRT